MSTAELTADFKSCAGESWRKIDRRAHEYFAQKCSRSLMYSKGFWKAQIIDVSSRVHNDVYVVQISVGEGPRYRLGKLTVDGNEALSEQQILDIFGLKTGDVADGPALQKFVYEKLKQRYDELGYVQYNAEFEPTFQDPVDWKGDGYVDVDLTIDEGLRFSVRQVAFAGVDREKGASLIDEFMIKAGDTFSGQRLRRAINTLNDLGRFERIDVDQDVEIRTDEEAAEVDLVITLRPLN